MLPPFPRGWACLCCAPLSLISCWVVVDFLPSLFNQPPSRDAGRQSHRQAIHPNTHPPTTRPTEPHHTDLATLFYEWGWGQSFHFANRLRDESFAQSIKRHEYYLASRLVSSGLVIHGCCPCMCARMGGLMLGVTVVSLAGVVDRKLIHLPMVSSNRTASRRARSCWTAAAGWAGPCATSRASPAPASRALPSTSTRCVLMGKRLCLSVRCT